MAFTVTTDLTDIDTAEATTAWTTGALDPAKYVQGNNSIGWYSAKNTRSVNGVSSKSIAWSAGDHLYWWNSSDVIAVAEPQTTGTTTASGITIRVTLANGAYREWHVAGSDTWDGGWRCFVVDLGHTGTHLYASSGTFVDTSNITDVDIYIDLSNSGNIRNVPANNYADAIRVGTGITAYNTSAADAAFDLADIAANDNLVANKRGILEVKDNVIFAQGRVTIGDGAGTNHMDFNSSGEVFVFSLRDGTDGFGLVSADLYEFNFEANATGTDQDATFGVKVGTGDTATGRSGSIISAADTTVRWKMNWDDADIHNFKMYGSRIFGAFDGTGVIGIQAGTPVTSHEIIGNTFDSCGQIDTQDAVVRAVNILNSAETGTTFGALLWDESDIDIKNSLFVNNTNAIEIRDGDLTADMTITGFTFSGNTTDIRYEDTVDDWNCNVVDSTTPSITNAGAGTLTAVIAPVSTTITLKDNDTGAAIEGAWVYLEASDGTGPLPYQDTSTWTRSGTTATVVTPTDHNLSVGQKVLIAPNTGTADNSAYGVRAVASVTNSTTFTYTVTDAGATTGVTVDITGVLISEASAVTTGIADDTRSLSANQPINGYARKHTSSPYYKQSNIAGVVSNTNGLSLTVLLISDE
jgi:hypothetical protein